MAAVRRGSHVIEVSPIADEAEEQLSLDLYNAVWPHDEYTWTVRRPAPGSR